MEYINFNEAINYANNGYKLRRKKWLCNHITKLEKSGCRLNGKIVKGSIINGYSEYNPTEEDINATDWFILD